MENFLWVLRTPGGIEMSLCNTRPLIDHCNADSQKPPHHCKKFRIWSFKFWNTNLHTSTYTAYLIPFFYVGTKNIFVSIFLTVQEKRFYKQRNIRHRMLPVFLLDCHPTLTTHNLFTSWDYICVNVRGGQANFFFSSASLKFLGSFRNRKSEIANPQIPTNIAQLCLKTVINSAF